MTDLLSELENQYCPPLDTSTFLAIISDYDLNNPTSLADARQILDVITASADVEESTGFDPSGSSGAVLLDTGNNEITSDSGRTPVSSGSYTDDTSLSQGLEGLEFEDDTSKALRREYTSGLGELETADKEDVLIETFPGLKPFDIKWTLKKCKGDVGAAIEELLNQVFLEESGGRRKGIEAFEENVGNGTGKRKGKKKPSKGPQRRLESQENQPPPSSKWVSAREDVEFLTQHTQLPMQQVSSLYHTNGGTRYQTIAAIVSAHQDINLDTTSDPDIQINAYTLSQEFPSLPPETCTALIELTHPSTSSAHALATALLSRPKPATGGITFDFRLPPPDLSDTAKPYAHNSVNNQFASAVDPAAASSLAASYKTSRNANFDQASAAFRRGKSDHLYGGVAAYYASIGRDYDVRAKAATAQAAEALVAQQSGKNSCDLHGVGVKDAVRIARERVTGWWAAGGVGGAYRIVVGVGNHSEGGRGKLGPAVGKMLIREGWKVEIGNGVLVVTGVIRKK